MKLTKKIFIYSVTVMLALTLIISGYFFFMLSPLYASFQETTRLNNVQEIQKSHINQTFDPQQNSYAKSSLTFSTIILPKEGYEVDFETNVGGMTFEIVDNGTRELLDYLRTLDYSDDFDKSAKATEKEFEKYMEYINTTFFLDSNMASNPFFKITENRFSEPIEDVAIFDSKIHTTDKLGVVLEAKANYQNNIFTNYVAIAEKEDVIYITLANAQTPLLHELQPIILQTMPVIFLLCLLLILLSLYFFNRLFIAPITQLSQTTKIMKEGSYVPRVKKGIRSNGDEFAQLEGLLDDLYTNLHMALDELQTANIRLEQKHENQQVFLAASSHQLKTPIASSLLLTEGMIDKIGKFADTDIYLPKLKEELLNIKHITEEILSLDLKKITSEGYSEFDLQTMIHQTLNNYTYLIEEKNIRLKIDLPEEKIFTHEVFKNKILDNIIKNAIIYSPNDAQISIYKIDSKLAIENSGVTLDDELISNIFEPFTRSFSDVKGSGLGLYIVQYFSAILQIEVTIKNNTQQDGVIAFVAYE